jgi:predicted nucleic acid-binding protein
MAFVLDASVTIPWAFATPNPYAAHVLELLAEDEALVPSIWPWEVANGILGGERRGLLDAAHSARFLSLLRELDITVEMTGTEGIISVVLESARAHNLSSYDAAYLELAMREGIALATADDALRAAALGVGVPLVEISARG